MGRPRKYKTPELLQEAIDKYFDNIAQGKQPPTMTGLALELGFSSRKDFLRYVDKDIKYSHAIKKARARVEKHLEESLLGSKQVAGIIFNLKNNFGWVDKKEIKAEGKVKLIMDK